MNINYSSLAITGVTEIIFTYVQNAGQSVNAHNLITRINMKQIITVTMHYGTPFLHAGHMCALER